MVDRPHNILESQSSWKAGDLSISRRSALKVLLITGGLTAAGRFRQTPLVELASYLFLESGALRPSSVLANTIDINYSDMAVLGGGDSIGKGEGGNEDYAPVRLLAPKIKTKHNISCTPLVIAENGAVFKDGVAQLQTDEAKHFLQSHKGKVTGIWSIGGNSVGRSIVSSVEQIRQLQRISQNPLPHLSDFSDVISEAQKGITQMGSDLEAFSEYLTSGYGNVFENIGFFTLTNLGNANEITSPQFGDEVYRIPVDNPKNGLAEWVVRKTLEYLSYSVSNEIIKVAERMEGKARARNTKPHFFVQDAVHMSNEFLNGDQHPNKYGDEWLAQRLIDRVSYGKVK